MSANECTVKITLYDNVSHILINVESGLLISECFKLQSSGKHSFLVEPENKQNVNMMTKMSKTCGHRITTFVSISVNTSGS